MTPKVMESCQSVCTWLESTRPRPSSRPPATATARVPMRSESAPHTKEPSPIATQLSRATDEMAPRLQPMASATGLRNTPSENSAPMPMQITTAEAATTIQP
jgi:hypothetical protein